MDTQTKGAITAANVIINEKAYIKTVYGRKTAEGIADLIDRETHSPELMRLLEQCLAIIENYEEIIQGEWGYRTEEVVESQLVCQKIMTLLDLAKDLDPTCLTASPRETP